MRGIKIYVTILAGVIDISYSEGNMKISIITVVYNDVLGISKTIESVLSQNYPNKEYLIIDGGSSDGTLDVIKSYLSDIDYFLSERDHGIYDAMNKGIKAAKGDYVLFLNSGDVFFNDCVLNDSVLQFSPKSDVIYGSCVKVEPDGREMLCRPYPLSKIKRGPVFRHNAAFFKLDTHKQFLFDLLKAKDFGYALDFDVIYRMYNANKSFQEINNVIMRYKDEGVSSNKKMSAIYAYRVIHSKSFVLSDWILFQIKMIWYFFRY